MRSSLRLIAVLFVVAVPLIASAADKSPRTTINLDGAWQIAEGKMDEVPKAFDRTVPVPGLADMATPAFEGVGVKDKDPRREAFWYRRTFKVEGAVRAVARLKVHKACYGTRVFLNGQLVGDHVGSFTPGYFDVRDNLKGDGQANELVIRVGASHPAVGNDVPWGHDFEKIRYVPGIYDSVELILTGTPWIESVQVVPDVPGKKARVVVALRHDAKAANPATVKLVCVANEAMSMDIVGSGRSDPATCKPGEHVSVETAIPIEKCRLWMPEAPFLYTVRVALDSDMVVTRFGMRSFSFDPQTKLPMLNGKPYYLRGTNICIYRFFEDPKRGDKPWREEWVRNCIRAFRSMNWNSCRYCIGFPPEMWYRIADEEGLMIQDEFPVWGKTGSLENLTAQYAEWMQERWNHPSVIIWDAQNETPKQHITGQALSAVRKLDLSNRPWDNGWDDPQCPTDVYETHPYRHIKRGFRMSEFAKMSPRPGDPGSDANNEAPNKFDNPIIINEYGWLWLNRDGSPTTIPVHSKSYEHLLPPNPTPDQYREAYARVLAAKTEFWRTGRKVAGVMHFCGLGYSRPGGQTSDNFIDIEKPTFEPHFYQYVRDAFAPVGLMLNFWEEQCQPGAALKLPVVVINDLDTPWQGPIALRLTRDGRTLAEKTQPGKVAPLGREVFTFELTAPVEPGKYQFTAELAGADGRPVRSLRDFSVPGAAQARPLWQIGKADRSAAEFALAQDGYAQFLQRFGSPDRAFYVGLSEPARAWPCVLPGPLDAWAGSGHGGRWDQMNTLPVGFVLDSAPVGGECVLAVDVLDASKDHPPRLRATVNGAIYEVDIPRGGGDESLRGDYAKARPHAARIAFPASLLRSGYNEIALRSTRGSWLVFDGVRLETPPGAELAAPWETVVRSVTAAFYAVSDHGNEKATVRVEVYQHDKAGDVTIAVGDAPGRRYTMEPGVQVLEVPAAASAQGQATLVRVLAPGRLLRETRLDLPECPLVTPADYVDVFLGTAHSRWMIAPGPWMPFGMVKLAPDNQTQGWIAGYEYSYEFIDCFSHIHEWTMGGLGMMPTVGPLRTRPGLDGAGYSSRIDKATERGGIGFYEVVLKDTGIKVELAATTRASLQRYTFPASEQARVLLDFLLPNEYEMRVLGAKVRRTGPAELEGTVQTEFPEGALFGDGCQRFDLHFVMQFSRPFDTLGGWEGTVITSDAQEVAGKDDCGAFVELKTAAGEKVAVRTGISLVSLANARLNLDKELAGPFGWDFAAVVRNQRRAWNELLARVQIETPDAREKTRFYSNLYRAMVGRNIFSDVNGQWTDPQERVQQLRDPDAVMLGCDAFWNTFWNLNQVMNLVAPEWTARWVKSQLAMYDACGWLSKGPAGLEYISIMVAEHEIALLVAACQHGLKGLDREKILEAVVKMQTALPQKHPGGGWVGNENLGNYLKHGYVALDGAQPGDWKGPSCSNTCEYAYDDWCVAQLALALGKRDLAATFLKRSQSWRNVFDPQSGFARPRSKDGRWQTPFDPFHTPGFVEGNAWQYTWFVPQDVPALVAAMGRERFLSRLTEAFEKSAPTRFNAAGERYDQFPINHGNQPTMQAAWLFNWAGKPWLSQKWTRAILDSYYGHNPADAYLGDEDQGQMSAWFVISAMGLFQTDGGCRVEPIYELGSPLYPKITLRLSPEHYGGKAFTILARNASRSNRYIQSARLNGKPLEAWWIAQREVASGGTLELELGPQPNEAWAAAAPPPPIAVIPRRDTPLEFVHEKK